MKIKFFLFCFYDTTCKKNGRQVAKNGVQTVCKSAFKMLKMKSFEEKQKIQKRVEMVLNTGL